MRSPFTAGVWALLCLTPAITHAFCGTYVGGPGSQIKNKGSQIVVARPGGDLTVLTMFNDFQGEPEDFGLVVPFPTSLTAEQVRTIDAGFVERLDLYSMPREVRYSCDDFYTLPPDATSPAPPPMDGLGDTGDWELDDTGEWLGNSPSDTGGSVGYSSGCGGFSSGGGGNSTWYDFSDDDDDSWYDEQYDVMVEDHFEFGEYEAFVLSADEGGGLYGWLSANGFELQGHAASLLDEQIGSSTNFLAVRIAAGQVSPGSWLSPIQVVYRSQNVSLPIRLGAQSSAGVQDLTLYTLTTRQRGAIANYPEVDVDSECLRDPEQPLADWYEDHFAQATGVSNNETDVQSGVGWMTEYSWTTPPPPSPSLTFSAHCDPCVTEPDEVASPTVAPGQQDSPLSSVDVGVLGLQGGALSGFHVTRLHMRYTPDVIDQDLSLYFTDATADQQKRYVQHSWELEALIPTCGSEQPTEPGTCFSSEYWLRRAEQRADGQSVSEFAEPKRVACGGSRAGFFLALPFLAILRRRT